MKVVAIELLRQQENGEDPIILSTAYEVSSYGYFQRPGIRQMLNFFSRTFVKRTKAGQRQSITHEEYTCHVYVKADGLSGIVFTNPEYPKRVVFALLNKLTESYHAETNGAWVKHKDDPKPWPPLIQAVADYQDPTEADKICAIQRDLDETTAILSKTIDNVLERGEKLDDLVNKSQDLSNQSKVFYKQAKKTNACCVVM
uniref:Synaptobrevinlike protein putative n=1 Tax=Albugo laibachii Nc14 TaxID=890382 RepID=F0VZQ6_9STRA|nr:synaptobrevinlike protein putative [Albugo laibachii Nc14]|eukprot:CCA14277.1 synaptobrevinlike protein putative [Albugo laibachii Nc14]